MGSEKALHGWRVQALVYGLGASVLVAHAASYWPFFADDSFISMRYAERLFAGDGLTWTDGERVEGYSNLLWVLLLAASRAITADMVLAARAMGLAGALAALSALVHQYRPRTTQASVPVMFGVLVIAFAGPFAAWSIAGLEAGLLAGGLAWGTHSALRQTGGTPVGWRSALVGGIPFALVALTRNDGALFCATACAALVLGARFQRHVFRDALALAVIPATAFISQLLFRVAYYGDWVSNTAHAKVALTWSRVESGWTYLSADDWLMRAPFVLGVLSLLVLPFLRRIRFRRLFVPTTMFWAWFAYILFIGGDNMPQRRHVVPLVVLAGFIGAELLFWARSSPRRAGAATLLAGVLLGHLAGVQVGEPQRGYAIDRDWVWDGVSSGALFRRAFEDERALVAVDAAGSFPYYSRLPSLDMLGLNDRYIASHPPETFGSGWVGHELGDGDYVLRRGPDFILPAFPLGATRLSWTGGRQLEANPEFRRRYRLLRFRTPEGLNGHVFARVNSPRVGVSSEPGCVRVPGFMMAAPPARWELNQGHPAARLEGMERVRLGLPLEAGRWEVVVEADGDPSVSLGGQPAGEGPVTVGSEQPLSRLEIRAEHGPVWLRQVVLRHAGREDCAPSSDRSP